MSKLREIKEWDYFNVLRDSISSGIVISLNSINASLIDFTFTNSLTFFKTCKIYTFDKLETFIKFKLSYSKLFKYFIVSVI